MGASIDRKMFYGASPDNFRNAKLLRKNETGAEKILWTKINKNQLNGYRFKRQHPIGNCIADFYCHKAKLVIEIDGEYHRMPEQELYDTLRTKELDSYGLRIIRFTNDEIYHKIDNVIKTILGYLPIPK